MFQVDRIQLRFYTVVKHKIETFKVESLALNVIIVICLESFSYQFQQKANELEISKVRRGSPVCRFVDKVKFKTRMIHMKH